MSFLRAIFLMPEATGALVRSLAVEAGVETEAKTLSSQKDLEEAMSSQQYDLLLSFGTGVIVPESILLTPGLVALNVHAASPDFPGRDPHHFAAYRRSRYQ